MAMMYVTGVETTPATQRVGKGSPRQALVRDGHSLYTFLGNSVDYCDCKQCRFTIVIPILECVSLTALNMSTRARIQFLTPFLFLA
jgi:hypothetical protein